MSMSTNVTGFVPPDDKWRKMKEIYDACEAANIVPPGEVLDFFEETNGPDPAGISVDLDGVLEPYHGDMEDGYELRLDDIPEKVKILRFTNSW